MQTQTTGRLDEARVAYRVLRHDAPVFTCDDAARARGMTLAQITKTMLGKDPAGQLYAILLPGDRRLKIKRVRQAAGGQPIELVPPDEISSQLGLILGAISPVDLLGRAEIYIDRRLLDQDTISISAGVPEAGIALSPRDLAELLGGQVGDFVSTSASEGRSV